MIEEGGGPSKSYEPNAIKTIDGEHSKSDEPGSLKMIDG